MNTILVCEDSQEGIFTAIYEAYEKKKCPNETILQIGETENYTLFSEYQQVEPNFEKAGKVARTVNTRLGSECYEIICKCLASHDKQKAQAVYQCVVLALKLPRPASVMERLTDDFVRRVFELSREVNNEIQHLRGFLRFQELEQGVLFSKIGPKGNVITFLAPHFADRLPMEHFVIYDEKRELIVVHPAGKSWTLVRGETIEEDLVNCFTEEEKEYQELFTYFCHRIAIEERKNWNLQRQMLPLRFRKYMGEF